MRLTQRKWILCWSALGLFVPALLLICSMVFNHSFGGVGVVLWLTSLILMALDAPGPLQLSDLMAIVTFYGIALLTNILLYAVVGLFCFQFIDLVRRRSGGK
jgi:hypothetical protein